MVSRVAREARRDPGGLAKGRMAKAMALHGSAAALARMVEMAQSERGMSEAQFREMTQANVQLVVPEPLIAKFPASIRTDIVTLESFLGDLRLLVPGAV